MVVVAPCSYHLDNQEANSRSDVVLNRQDIMSILDVEESPEDANDRIHYCESAVEGQLGDLSSG